MSKSSLFLVAQDPIYLDNCHHLARLIVINAYVHVLHNGVKKTLTVLRSEYCLLKRRQIVRKVIHDSHPNPAPPPPEHCTQQTHPFQITGVDFAGPLYVRTSDTSSTS